MEVLSAYLNGRRILSACVKRSEGGSSFDQPSLTPGVVQFLMSFS